MSKEEVVVFLMYETNFRGCDVKKIQLFVSIGKIERLYFTEIVEWSLVSNIFLYIISKKF